METNHSRQSSYCIVKYITTLCSLSSGFRIYFLIYFTNYQINDTYLNVQQTIVYLLFSVIYNQFIIAYCPAGYTADTGCASLLRSHPDRPALSPSRCCGLISGSTCRCHRHSSKSALQSCCGNSADEYFSARFAAHICGYSPQNLILAAVCLHLYRTGIRCRGNGLCIAASAAVPCLFLPRKTRSGLSCPWLYLLAG